MTRHGWKRLISGVVKGLTYESLILIRMRDVTVLFLRPLGIDGRFEGASPELLCSGNNVIIKGPI